MLGQLMYSRILTAFLVRPVFHWVGSQHVSAVVPCSVLAHSGRSGTLPVAMMR